MYRNHADARADAGISFFIFPKTGMETLILLRFFIPLISNKKERFTDNAAKSCTFP